MKVATIFMLSAVLILIYCLTTQGHHIPEKRHGKSGVARWTQHGESPGSLQGGKKTIICICNHKNGHILSMWLLYGWLQIEELDR
ncbi:unnamed protein product [Ranitomeya imitator]|uniref:Uncharacterized protein n=1 Tax=Ranitomeya imitator TaxID=111125 RepID=A0ABN9KY24_9NEOB|nr:unnamed protein product [Ranitomeya imitator]